MTQSSQGSSSASGTWGGQSSSYFDIDDILASQEKVPCTIQQELYHLGYIDPGSEDEHVPINTKLELPFWLASSLCRQKKIVDVDIPKAYREAQREILKADANVVNLHKLGPYYYAFGSKVILLEHRERADISRTLLETFLNRVLTIIDQAQHSYTIDTVGFTRRLDIAERVLFASGRDAAEVMQNWTSARSHLLVSGRKRRHDSESKD